MVSSGGVAEWLGRGLQSPVLRFESGRRLQRWYSLRFVAWRVLQVSVHRGVATGPREADVGDGG